MFLEKRIFSMSVQKRFADRLALARLEAGHTQETLAECLGVGVHTIRNYEGLRSFPGPDKIEQLSTALSRSPAWFFLSGSEQLTAHVEMSPETALSSIRAGLEFLESQSQSFLVSAGEGPEGASSQWQGRRKRKPEERGDSATS